MAKKKKTTQLDLIKSVRKPFAPKGKTFKVKTKTIHRKRKHKGSDE